MTPKRKVSVWISYLYSDMIFFFTILCIVSIRLRYLDIYIFYTLLFSIFFLFECNVQPCEVYLIDLSSVIFYSKIHNFILKCNIILQTTSSESTSTTSSGSSSSSSSSSGSESSSSDSENSSSSANSQKASDTERIKKKASFPVTRHVKSKAETTSTLPLENKNKDRQPPKPRSAIYSSESEESPIKAKSSQKRKPPAKPKATATVAPVVKTQRSPAKPVPISGQHKVTPVPKPINSKPNKFSGMYLFLTLLKQ